MSRRAVFQSAGSALIWIMFATLAALVGALPAPQDNNANAGPLPFLQFTKGGIRVNFGGYHAQAGLGGLLTGSKADGGLHASAGTPGGAHASAGLGGSLDGGPAGGLHARAGLGNGGPEAEAGLGGTLAGPQPRGELYAGSTAGNYSAVLDRINGIEGSEKSKNIQVISRPKKASDQETPSSSSASSSASANAGVSGSAADAAPERAAPPPQGPATPATTAQPPAPVPRQPNNRPKLGVFARAAAGAGGESESQPSHKSTLFDDIFNIPISALNAVNKLLRNHVGRK